MTVSRRRLLSAAGAGVAAFALDGDWPAHASAAAVPEAPAAAAAAQSAADVSLISPTSVYLGTTSWDFTVQRGSYDATGYQTLVAGEGEPHYVRDDLWPNQGHVTLPLVAFAQMTDLHIVDDQSTARLEFLDSYADPPYKNYGTDSAYRPHEYLSTQVVDAMCLAISSIGKAPRTKLPLKFTIVTGDAVDNCQHNENRWYIDLLDGGQTIVPDSGQVGLDESFSSGALLSTANKHYYYPSVPAAQTPDNIFTGSGSPGFPLVPDLLRTDTAGAARRPYVSHGLGMPWYAAYGNHDGMWQGNLPINSSLFNPDPIARGSLKIAGSEFRLIQDHNVFILGTIDQLLASQNLVGVEVTPDATRRMLSRQDFIADHFTTAGTPVGHGFMSPSDDRAYYAIPWRNNDLVRFITLDSTNTNTDGLGQGDAGGSIGTEQLDWLENQLLANSRRYLNDYGNLVTVAPDSPVQDKLFVLFCHHTLDTMHNLDAGLAGNVTGDRHTGDELGALLLRYPNVIALVNGHTHANKITPHARPQGNAIPGGFWEISTASHIDWPIQSRILEIAASKEGNAGPATISIFTTMLDPAAPLVYNGDLSNTSQLASLARELATNDPQEVRGGIRRRMGVAGDRNAQLLLPAPFPINAPHEAGAQLAVSRNADGRLELFGLSGDGAVFNTAQSTAAGAVLPWQQLDLQTWQCVTTGSGTADGKVELYTLDQAGVIWQRAQTTAGSSTYTPPAALDGTWTAMAAVNDDSGLMLVACAPTGEVFFRFESADGSGGGWGSWRRLSGASATQLTAEQNSKGLPVIIGVDENGVLFRSTAVRANPQTASDFSTPTGLNGNLDSLALTRTSDGRLALYGVTGDGQLWQRYETTPGTDLWDPWTLIPAQVGIIPMRIRQIAAERNGTGTIELFVMDDTGAVHRSAQPAVGSFDWTPWTGAGFNAQPADDFSLTLSSATGSVGMGTSTTTQVSVWPKNGFREAVTMSVAGLPPGVTGTFLPPTTTPTAPTPVLRLTCLTDASGTYPLTIWGTSESGQVARAQPYILTVGAFKLWLSLQSDTVAQGNSTTTELRVSGAGSSAVTKVNVAGLPNGVTASFSPATPTAGTPSVLTLSVSFDAVPGLYALTVFAAGSKGGASLPYQLNVVTGVSSW